MPSLTSTPLKMISWATLAAAIISMFATPALSQTAQPYMACLQADGAHCRLVAPTVGISVGVAEGDAIISYYVPDLSGWKIDHRDSISRDMEAQVVSGQMSEEDAAYIFAELLSSHDLSYKLPADPTELKKSVGFPETAQFTPQDQVDILASHLQMNLGVSAVTADYLVMKLGLQIIE